MESVPAPPLRTLNLLKLASRHDDYDVLMAALDGDGDATPAVPILRRRGGLLVAFPSEFFTDEDLQSFSQDDSAFGTHHYCEVAARGSTDILLPVVIVDVEDTTVVRWPKWVSRASGPFVRYAPIDQDAVPQEFGTAGALPDGPGLSDAARSFLADGTQDLGAARGYVTAESGGEREPRDGRRRGADVGPPEPPPEPDAAAFEEAEEEDTAGADGRERRDRREAPAARRAPRREAAAPSMSARDFEQMLMRTLDARLTPLSERLSRLESAGSASSGLNGARGDGVRSDGARAEGIGPQLFAQARQVGLSDAQGRRLAELAGPRPRLGERPVPRTPGRYARDPAVHEAVVPADADGGIDGDPLEDGDEADEVAQPPEAAAPVVTRDGLVQAPRPRLAARPKAAPAVAPAAAIDPTVELLAGLLREQQILSRQHLQQRPSAPTDPLALLSTQAADGSSTNLSGLRGIAARQLLHERIVADPEGSNVGFEARLAKNLKTTPDLLVPSSLSRFFDEVTPFGDKKLLVYMAALVGQIYATTKDPNCSREQIKADVATAAIFVDQVAVQGGSSYQLAWLMTGLEEPQWERLAQRKPPKLDASQPSSTTFSRLADPRQVTANLAFMEDLSSIASRTLKTSGAKPPRKDEQTDDQDGGQGAGGKRKHKPPKKEGE